MPDKPERERPSGAKPTRPGAPTGSSPAMPIPPGAHNPSAGSDEGELRKRLLHDPSDAAAVNSLATRYAGAQRWADLIELHEQEAAALEKHASATSPRVKLRRAGGDVPLHGGSSVLSWSTERKASTRLCCRGAFLDGDTVVLQREGDTVATLPVRVTLDAVALGALRDVAGPNAAVSSACAAVTTVDALDACALLGAGGAP